MHASENLAISTQGLSKSYQGVNALQPLDLQVACHSIFGFLEPNGAGKSTTIKLLLGLSKPSRTSARPAHSSHARSVAERNLPCACFQVMARHVQSQLQPAGWACRSSSARRLASRGC